jgi:hypothetical protein
MTKTFPFLLFLIFLPASGRAAPAPADLGDGLSYRQVSSLADAGPAVDSAATDKPALVLDLRRTETTEASVATFLAALARHPADAPLFVLVSPETPSAIVAAVNRAPGACLTIGRADPRSSARVQVRTDAASDRRAFDAIAAGAPVGTLISGHVEKERFDEAALMDEFRKGNLDPEPAAEPDPSSGSAQKERPLVDRVLQRAVEIRRALLALRPKAPKA